MGTKASKAKVIERAFEFAEKIITENEYIVNHATTSDMGARAADRIDLAKSFKLLLSESHEELIKLENYGNDDYRG
ncbi:MULTISPECIES: hypothetical protein [Acinetobacter calcoaceticus/baumannii complex]|uniref:hypothetical protein n=1 Tax=Acinetobacter calcoaceticus/baumannii complex TaxID=909768 RepID=UPI002263AC6E|nr:hypothetical protein [Acinetobacter pittii]MCG9496930.1 hypothetical protein [Acinetobacter pittii]